MPQQRQNRKHSAVSAPVSVLLVFAAVVFGLSIFFRVSRVEVEGNSFYSAEEVMEASGIEEGDNLFFINRFSAISRIFSRLPYVETAGVTRAMPNKVLITVTESKAIAYVQSEDGVWSIDWNCKILSRLEDDDTEGLILIKNLTPSAPEAGQPLQTAEDDQTKVSYVSEILTQMQGLELRGRVTWLDMSDPAAPSFDFDGRFTVKLGKCENTAYKFQLLLGAVEKLKDGDRGILDLSIDNKVHLIYE